MRQSVGRVQVRLLAAPLVVAVAMLVVPVGARGAMVGFTGDQYYCDHQLTPANSSCPTPSRHSWAFNSATYRGSGTVPVCSSMYDPVSGGVGVVCGNNLARFCLQGTYPNCTDIDGFLATASVYNGSAYAHTIEGHGLY